MCSICGNTWYYWPNAEKLKNRVRPLYPLQLATSMIIVHCRWMISCNLSEPTPINYRLIRIDTILSEQLCDLFAYWMGATVALKNEAKNLGPKRFEQSFEFCSFVASQNCRKMVEIRLVFAHDDLSWHGIQIEESATVE